MEQQEIIADIERKAWERRISIARLCLLADVHPTTFWKWKKSDKNPNPGGASLKTINKIYAAFDEIDHRTSLKGVAA